MKVEYTLKNGVKVTVEKQNGSSSVISINIKGDITVIDDIKTSDLKNLANLISLISSY